jgi:hypothetical protein
MIVLSVPLRRGHPVKDGSLKQKLLKKLNELTLKEREKKKKKEEKKILTRDGTN